MAKYAIDASSELVEKVAAEELAVLKPFCATAVVAGSIRRRKGVYKDVDIIVLPKNEKDKAKIMLYVAGMPTGNIGQGKKLVSYNKRGVEVDVYFASKENWGAMLLYLTGPQMYNIWLRKLAKIRGFKLNQYGLWKGGEIMASRTEQDIYEALGKEWKSPELRGLNEAEAQRLWGVKAGQRNVGRK